MGEIVMIEMKGRRANGAWMWQALLGQPQRGEQHLDEGPVAAGEVVGGGISVGQQFVAQVATSGTGWRIERILRSGSSCGQSQAGPLPTPMNSNPLARPKPSGPADQVPRRSTGGGTSGSVSEAGFRVGDVLIRRFRFTNLSKGEMRMSKRRPCVVVELLERELRVRPIFGTNTSVRRQGQGRRLRHWEAAGLNKPSVVSAEDIVIRDGGSEPIGRLSATDMARIVHGAGCVQR